MILATVSLLQIANNSRCFAAVRLATSHTVTEYAIACGCLVQVVWSYNRRVLGKIAQVMLWLIARSRHDLSTFAF